MLEPRPDIDMKASLFTPGLASSGKDAVKASYQNRHMKVYSRSRYIYQRPTRDDKKFPRPAYTANMKLLEYPILFSCIGPQTG